MCDWIVPADSRSSHQKQLGIVAGKERPETLAAGSRGTQLLFPQGFRLFLPSSVGSALNLAFTRMGKGLEFLSGLGMPNAGCKFFVTEVFLLATLWEELHTI